MEFLAGYLVEKSLSVDNLFVFALVFRYFRVPDRYQHRVLFYCVLGAIVFRGIFIAAGSALVRFEWVLMAFGLFLIVSGVRLAFERESHFNPGESRIIRTVHRFLPVTPELHGARFLVRIGGCLYATPLLVVLLFIESTDIMFATDSVPAVFGVTREPFVVYSSNLFAILGLRALFFVLSGAMERFHILKHGLAVVLAFVGLKMVLLDRLFGGRFPIAASLAIISVVLAASIVLSLALPKSTEPWSPQRRTALKTLCGRVLGVLFLCLSAAAFWYAAWPTLAPIPLPDFAEVGSQALYVSALCYAFCAALLLGGRFAGPGQGR